VTARMPAIAGSTAEQEKFLISGDTSISRNAKTGEPVAKMNKYYRMSRDDTTATERLPETDEPIATAERSQP
jgi:hypothetical protein